MKGNEEMLCRYMEGSSKRFIIPVYQRNYDWEVEQCKKLFDDLVKVHENKSTHFFGSIVSTMDDQPEQQEYLIIDGQQRLTTISLMLLALHDLLIEGEIETEDESLTEKIKNEYLIDKYKDDVSRIKLKPVKDDAEAFTALINETGDHIRASNITINYNYFYNRILKEEITAKELFNAFCRLQIINIFLGNEDNPQLIFESLNSTGVDLSEGDKIRNYILMDVKPNKLQEIYYEKYWYKIEQFTNYKVSAFVRDYLSIKMQSTPAMKKVYLNFKEFMDTDPFKELASSEDPLATREELMKDLLSYAKRYEILLKANSENNELNSIIDRLNRFEATVTRPFLMEVIKHSENKNQETVELSQNDLLKTFKIIESYIFRRQMCDIPTNALNKVFVALNNEIIRYDDTTENYLEKLKYTLVNKTASGIFPENGMFAEGLSNKQVYLMRSKNKKYIMERLENWGTKEVKDVWKLIDERTYTIEHIMPKTLNNEWKNELGPDYEVIHEEWIDKLANLTLTGYNSEYSNGSFLKKRDMKNGFYDSGLRMNQHIAKKDKWTRIELEERNQRLIDQGLKIWPMVETNYEPPEKVMESVILADEISMKGRQIFKISFLGEEQTVKSWTDAYIKVLSVLHTKNPTILFKLASDKRSEGLSNHVNDSDGNSSSYSKLEEGIYLWVNSNTDAKLNALRRFFDIYDVEEEELTFYLRDKTTDLLDDLDPSEKKRKQFWIKALPFLNKKTEKFKNISPSTSNWQSTFIGHSGINITVIANLNEIRIELYIGKGTKQINDDIFNYIKRSQNSIEKESHQIFTWTNEEENVTSKISIGFEDIGISNKSNWQACIDLLADGVNTISKHLVPKVDEYFNE